MDSLSELLSSLGDQLPRLDARVAGAELYGAPRLSIFRLLGPGELSLSRVIADILDPHGTHGQGELFLNSLLVTLGLPPVGIHDMVRVGTEVRTGNDRRIDIVVETPTILLGIENKPWAIQQESQLKDYCEYIASAGRGKATKLIFLSDQEPEFICDQIVRISYKSHLDHFMSLSEVLLSVFGSIKADRTRAFVRDFVEYIDTQFGDGLMGNDQYDPYIQAVLAEFNNCPERRKALATVLLSQRTLHHRIISDVGEFLLSRVKQEVAPDFQTGRVNANCWTFEPGNAPLMLDKKWEAWGVRRPEWPTNCAIVIDADQGDYQRICYGVYAPADHNETKKYPQCICKARVRLEHLKIDVAGGISTPWWPWYMAAKQSTWGPEFAARIILESPNGDVARNQGIQQLAGTFVQLARAVDEALRRGSDWTRERDYGPAPEPTANA